MNNKKKYIIDSIHKKLGLIFNNEKILIKAFTHTSYINDKSIATTEHNERLEFLGDAIVELVVSDYLYHNFLQLSEGELTRFRAQLVCEKTLSTLAKECGFDELVLIGKGEENMGGRKRPALLCDLFEAFVGALYLDRGIDVAKTFVLSQIVPKMDEVSLFVDYKTLLQEYLQQNGVVSIVYKVIDEFGPSHNKIYNISVEYNGLEIGRGTGKSKKSAQQEAAKMAYENRGDTY